MFTDCRSRPAGERRNFYLKIILIISIFHQESLQPCHYGLLDFVFRLILAGRRIILTAFESAESPWVQRAARCSRRNDPWFHLHQTFGAIEHFPHLIRWDVGTFYPTGGRVAAAGLFNLVAAGFALVFGLGACRTYPARLRKTGFRPKFPLVFVICVFTQTPGAIGARLYLGDGSGFERYRLERPGFPIRPSRARAIA